MFSVPIASRVLGRSYVQSARSIIPRALSEQRTTAGNVRVTNKLELIDPSSNEKFPMFQVCHLSNTYCFYMKPVLCFQVMDLDGKILPGSKASDFSEEKAKKIYQTMVRIQALDDVFYNAQVCRFPFV